mmetsp:Transcript_134705/g.430328  ORF Transcript_134705/g.430328 Transcript_134705/m.430328 type:complete len:393 (+) Transcript_134705:49-1227(+)
MPLVSNFFARRQAMLPASRRDATAGDNGDNHRLCTLIGDPEPAPEPAPAGFVDHAVDAAHPHGHDDCDDDPMSCDSGDDGDDGDDAASGDPGSDLDEHPEANGGISPDCMSDASGDTGSYCPGDFVLSYATVAGGPRIGTDDDDAMTIRGPADSFPDGALLCRTCLRCILLVMDKPMQHYVDNFEDFCEPCLEHELFGADSGHGASGHAHHALCPAPSPGTFSTTSPSASTSASSTDIVPRLLFPELFDPAALVAMRMPAGMDALGDLPAPPALVHTVNVSDAILQPRQRWARPGSRKLKCMYNKVVNGSAEEKVNAFVSMFYQNPGWCFWITHKMADANDQARRDRDASSMRVLRAHERASRYERAWSAAEASVRRDERGAARLGLADAPR